MFKKIALLLLVFSSQSLLARDFETWWSLDGKVKNFMLLGETRFRNDSSEAYYYHIELNYHQKLPCNFTLIPGYRHAYREKEPHKWIHEPIPFLALLQTWEALGFSLSNRNRIEYRSDDEKWLFRTRLTVSLPLSLTLLSLNPYCSNEFFFFEGEGFNEDRIFIGVKKDLFSLIEGKIGYLQKQTREEGDWVRTDILYGSLSFDF